MGGSNIIQPFVTLVMFLIGKASGFSDFVRHSLDAYALKNVICQRKRQANELGRGKGVCVAPMTIPSQDLCRRERPLGPLEFGRKISHCVGVWGHSYKKVTFW